MKKMLLLLSLCIMLSACGGPVQGQQTILTTENTVSQPAESTAETEPGSVSFYNSQLSDAQHLYMLGKNPLLRTESGRLVLVDSEKGDTAASAEIGELVGPAAISVSAMGVCYYDAYSGEAVILNPVLQEMERISLPETMDGPPACSMEMREIFYTQGQELRGLNLNSGISRLIKTQNCKKQEILGVFFHGSLLQCRVTDIAGGSRIMYIETETGRTVSDDQNVTGLVTGEDFYFAWRKDGKVQQQIFGLRDQPPRGFRHGENLYPVPEFGCVLQAEISADELMLSYYDLNQGMLTGNVRFSGVSAPIAVASAEGYLWILACASSGEEQLLIRWDGELSILENPVSCEVPLFSAENADEQGIAACKLRAEALSRENGIQIYLGNDAAFTDIQSYEGEYQVPVITEMLDQLEPVLPRFPADFYRKTMRIGRIKVCLVRSVGGELTAASSFAGGSFWIFLTPDSIMEQDFILELGHAVDSFVLGNSRKYDDWKDLNPKGFHYFLDSAYEHQGEMEESNHLTDGENRYFADFESLGLPTIERSRLLWYAMTPGSDEIFRGPAMQKKLEIMCRAIREAYGYEKEPEIYSWEQYLAEPIAYIQETE